MQALHDMDKDREIAMMKINSDFEAKVLAVVQKAEDSMNKHVGAKMDDLATNVRNLMSSLQPTPPAAQAGQSGDTDA
jgi:(p)ppGpp synthase/HD superfamily hydrolase